MPANQPYPGKNAGSWKTSPASPSTLKIPPVDMVAQTMRLRPRKTRLRTSSMQVFPLRTRDFADNVFSQSRSPSVSATTTKATRTVTQRLPPSAPAPNPPHVASVSPSPFAPPPRSTSHHQAAKQHMERDIVPQRDTARISTNSLLVDDPATREYVTGHASESQADPTRQSNWGSDSEMRGHDDLDQGPSQVCPSAHSACMHIHLRPCEQNLARASRRSSSSRSCAPSRRMSKAPLPPLPQPFHRQLPVRTSSPPTRQSKLELRPAGHHIRYLLIQLAGATTTASPSA